MPLSPIRVVPVAGDQLLELSVRGLAALVDPLEVADQLHQAYPSAGLACGVTGTDLRQQGLGLRGGEVLLRPARDQLEQQLVQLADHPGVVITQ